MTRVYDAFVAPKTGLLGVAWRPGGAANNCLGRVVNFICGDVPWPQALAACLGLVCVAAHVSGGGGRQAMKSAECISSTPRIPRVVDAWSSHAVVHSDRCS